uniref:Retrotransposon gag domain-containing protein n=1 Tax=Oryza brachyantha TaxID=4533 RepID=J3ND41_ORYBR
MKGMGRLLEVQTMPKAGHAVDAAQEKEPSWVDELEEMKQRMLEWHERVAEENNMIHEQIQNQENYPSPGFAHSVAPAGRRGLKLLRTVLLHHNLGSLGEIKKGGRTKILMLSLQLKPRAYRWITSLDVPKNQLSWLEFCDMVKKRFASKSNISITNTFRNLKQYGVVDSYIDKFEELMAVVKKNRPALTEGYFLEYFISGLKEHIKRPLKSLDIQSLVHAYEHARNYDGGNLHYKIALGGSSYPNRLGQK